MPDLAAEIFGDVGQAVANLNTPAEGDTSVGSDTPAEPETKDVDPQGQGELKDSNKPPATSGEKAESADKDGEKAAPEEKQPEKQKVDGAAQARKWGEQWEKTAKEHEATLKKHEPTLKMVEEKFGGLENLGFAAEIYQAITVDPENFDPANALEFLSNNLPDVATALTTHIAKEVIQRATDTAIQRTFGRALNEQEISAVTDFLASGKKTADEYARFFQNGDELPEDLLVDESGERLPQATIDYMRRQALQLKETQSQIKSLEGRMNQGDAAAQSAKAQQAVEAYAAEAFSVIDKKVTSLGLDAPVDGETPEIKAVREKYASMVEGLTYWLAGKDDNFQTMYHESLKNVARFASNPNNRTAKSKSVDYSLRLQAKLEQFADEAAELVSPLLETLSTTRAKQVDKVKQANDDLDVTGSTPPKGRENSGDPFDRDSIHAEVGDMRKAGRFKAAR